MTVVSFSDYTPPPRFDGVPWTSVLIDESATQSGPFVQIDQILLTPVDTDPAEPIARSFSTSSATIDSGGWYQISYMDDQLNAVKVPPVQNLEAFAWIPSLADVGSLVLARTRDSNGVVLGTFTDDTQPTDDQVMVLIQKAVDDVMPFIGTTIPDVLVQEAQNVTAIKAAMYIELTYYANEVAQNRSAYPELKDLYDEKLKALAEAISAVESGQDPADALVGVGEDGYGYPYSAFPPAFPYMDPRTC